MKKLNKLVLMLSLFLLANASASYADGNAFTPLDFNDASYAKTKESAAAVDNAAKADNVMDLSAGEIPIGNDNIQNAILELDNAQVGIRSDLLNYKAKYADVDAQYKLIKNERAMLSKQVKSIEKRIKNIDKAKEKIRKNML